MLVGSRGNLDVALVWKSGKLVKATITAKESKPVKVRYAGKEVEIQAKGGQTYELGPDLRR